LVRRFCGGKVVCRHLREDTPVIEVWRSVLKIRCDALKKCVAPDLYTQR
jgi:hypothetical protein